MRSNFSHYREANHVLQAFFQNCSRLISSAYVRNSGVVISKQHLGKAPFQNALLTVALGCVLLAAIAGCSSGESGIAATFYDEIIYEDEVSDYTADFRESRHYVDDETWAEYLAGEGLKAKTWRERVIGSIAEKRLLRLKAEELGVSPDDERIDAQIEQDWEAAGADDEDAWRDFLESRGETEGEYRDSLELASLEQQVYLRELNFDPEENADVIASFIKDNLADRVVYRYSALRYSKKADAKAALDELVDLDGEQLRSKFDDYASRAGSLDSASSEGGDIGWDIASNLGDAQSDLSQETLQPGQLSRQVHKIDGEWYVFLCTDRYVFKVDTDYNAIPDDELKDFVIQSVTYAQWQSMANEYLSSLLDQANIQVSPMPNDLPYDVDRLIESL